MTTKIFDYEDVCMGARDRKPDSYKLSFFDDYRLRSLTKSIPEDGGNFLDIGCGGGRISESIPYYYPKMKVFGCDVSKSAISYAEKYGSGKIHYKLIKGKKLPYKTQSFNVCICLDVLEHIPDIPFFLSEVKRILKKNGVFFIIVPCEGEPFTYTWFFQKFRVGNRLTYEYFGHIHPEFTHKSVLGLLKSYGFSIKETRYSEHIFYQWMHVCIFFVPKILLKFFFGMKTAHEYTNSSLLQSPKKRLSPLLLVRNIWFLFFNFLMRYPMSLETILFQKFAFPAWKLHVYASKT